MGHFSAKNLHISVDLPTEPPQNRTNASPNEDRFMQPSQHEIDPGSVIPKLGALRHPVIEAAPLSQGIPRMLMNNLFLALVFVASVIGPVFILMRAHAAKDVDPPQTRP